MSTAKELRELTAKKLSTLAKKAGVSGVSGMKKEDLVQAIVKANRAKARTTKKATVRKSTARKTVVKKTPAKKTATKKTTTSKRATLSSRASSSRNGKARSTRAAVTKKAVAKKSASKKSASVTTRGKTSKKKTVVKKSAAQKSAKATKKATRPVAGKAKPKAKPKPERKQDPRILKKLREDNHRKEQIKDLARAYRGGAGNNGNSNGEPAKDKIILIVRDSFWVQAYWEVTRATVERVQVALAEQWHNAVPTLRLFEIVDEGPTGASETIHRDIQIHGGVNTWYIPIDDPSKIYRVAVGFTTSNGRFHLLTRSNKVEMPEPGGSDAVDEHWTDIAEDYQRFFAMSGGYSEDHSNSELQEVFEEQLRRPMNAPKFTKFGVTPAFNGSGLDFQVECEMIVFGSTDPNATVFLADEPVDVESNGTFAVRVPMPDKRQVLPVVASSRDGSLQRTIVLAIERNTKVMEQVTKEHDES